MAAEQPRFTLCTRCPNAHRCPPADGGTVSVNVLAVSGDTPVKNPANLRERPSRRTTGSSLPPLPRNQHRTPVNRIGSWPEDLEGRPCVRPPTTRTVEFAAGRPGAWPTPASDGLGAPMTDL